MTTTNFLIPKLLRSLQHRICSSDDRRKTAVDTRPSALSLKSSKLRLYPSILDLDSLCWVITLTTIRVRLVVGGRFKDCLCGNNVDNNRFRLAVHRLEYQSLPKIQALYLRTHLEWLRRWLRVPTPEGLRKIQNQVVVASGFEFQMTTSYLN